MKPDGPNTLPQTDLLARRLAALTPLARDERALLLKWQRPSRCYLAGSEMFGAQNRQQHPKLIVSGWACRERITASGKRQLLSILLPGDLIHGCVNQRALDRVEVVAISNVHVMNISGILREVEDHPDRYAGIARGLSLMSLAEEGRFLDHMVRLGSQPALQRIASFVIELYQRCRLIDYVSACSFVMPLTQELLGNALGLSVVHVNRVMRQLKAERLINLHGGILKVMDVPGLAQRAGMTMPEPAGAKDANEICCNRAAG
jgi:CRP-like cAMP-binding protein